MKNKKDAEGAIFVPSGLSVAAAKELIEKTNLEKWVTDATPEEFEKLLATAKEKDDK